MMIPFTLFFAIIALLFVAPGQYTRDDAPCLPMATTVSLGSCAAVQCSDCLDRSLENECQEHRRLLLLLTSTEHSAILFYNQYAIISKSKESTRLHALEPALLVSTYYLNTLIDGSKSLLDFVDEELSKIVVDHQTSTCSSSIRTLRGSLDRLDIAATAQPHPELLESVRNGVPQVYRNYPDSASLQFLFDQASSASCPRREAAFLLATQVYVMRDILVFSYSTSLIMDTFINGARLAPDERAGAKDIVARAACYEHAMRQVEHAAQRYIQAATASGEREAVARMLASVREIRAAFSAKRRNAKAALDLM